MTFKQFLYLNAQSLLKKIKNERWIDLEIKYQLNKKYRSWIKEQAAEDAKKYQTRSAWKKSDSKTYWQAYRAGWLEEMCSHMYYYIKKQSEIRTREQCLEIARTYKTITEWKKKDNASLSYAKRHNWYNSILDELGFKKKVSKLYASTEEQAAKLRLTRSSSVNVILLTKQLCTDSFRKFKTKTEWYNAESGVYLFSKKMGWFDEITADMDRRFAGK